MMFLSLKVGDRIKNPRSRRREYFSFAIHQKLKKMKTLDDFCSKDEVTKRIDSLEKKLKRGRKIMKIIRKGIYPIFFLDAIAMIVLMFFDIKNTIFAGIFYGSIGIIGVSNILINIEDIEQKLSREKEILEKLN